MSNNTIEINWDDVLEIASGKDEHGIAASAASLALDEIKPDKTLNNLKEIYLSDAILNIHSSGGCVIITADFPPISRKYAKESSDLCESWLEDLNCTSKDNQLLSLTVTPFLLEGQIFVIFNQLVFTDTYTMQYGYQRLILGFDNLATMPIESQDINYREIVAEMESELKRREEQIDEEIEELLEQKKELEEQNEYGDDIRQQLNDIDTIVENSKKEEYNPLQGKTNARMAEEHSNVRFYEEDNNDDGR